MFHNLKTIATTRDRNGKLYSHAVSLERSNYPDFVSLVLRIHDTPGRWYLSTLLDKRRAPLGATISIDMGQNWDCINMDQIMSEVKSLFGTLVDPKTYAPIERGAVPATPADTVQALKLACQGGTGSSADLKISVSDVEPLVDLLASQLATPAPRAGIVETLQLIAGKGRCTLHRVENHAGDVYFRLRAETYQDGRRSCFTLIEYSSLDLARSEFNRLTGSL